MKFDPSKFEDKYEDALIDLIEAKKKGRRPPKAKPAARPSNVVNLFDALKKSLAEEGGGKISASKTGNPKKRKSA
jgi:DNA end-binding protein Ku